MIFGIHRCVNGFQCAPVNNLRVHRILIIPEPEQESLRSSGEYLEGVKSKSIKGNADAGNYANIRCAQGCCTGLFLSAGIVVCVICSGRTEANSESGAFRPPYFAAAAEAVGIGLGIAANI